MVAAGLARTIPLSFSMSSKTLQSTPRPAEIYNPSTMFSFVQGSPPTQTGSGYIHSEASRRHPNQKQLLNTLHNEMSLFDMKE